MKTFSFWYANFIRDPKSIASIAPSSKFLANKISNSANLSSDCVVLELGAGMGHVTNGLLERGVRPENIISVDINPSMVDYMKKNYPNINSYVYDATKVHGLFSSLKIQKADVIISSLGLLSFSQEMRVDLFNSAKKVLKKDGSFVQYTYGIKNPVENSSELGWECERVGRVFLNLPPATIYKYRQLD